MEGLIISLIDSIYLRKGMNKMTRKNATSQSKKKEDELILAFMNKDYEYILNRFDPLFKKNLSGVPLDHHDDFIQEHWIETVKIVEKNDFQKETQS